MAKLPARKQSKDLALLQGPTADGEGARIIRFRDGNFSAGEVRPIKEGQALNSQELLRLRPVNGAPAVCEVEVVHHQAKVQTTRSGPAQVATDTYRRNWNQVFADRNDERSPDRDAAPSDNAGRTGAHCDWSLN